MSSLPQPYGPAATTPREPEIAYSCECFADFTYEPELTPCAGGCEFEMCPRCDRHHCETCRQAVCEKCVVFIDGLDYCPACADRQVQQILRHAGAHCATRWAKARTSGDQAGAADFNDAYRLLSETMRVRRAA